jgi:hypothetical protein
VYRRRDPSVKAPTGANPRKNGDSSHETDRTPHRSDLS